MKLILTPGLSGNDVLAQDARIIKLGTRLQNWLNFLFFGFILSNKYFPTRV